MVRIGALVKPSCVEIVETKAASFPDLLLHILSILLYYSQSVFTHGYPYVVQYAKSFCFCH